MVLLEDLCIKYARKIINEGHILILSENKAVTKKIIALALKRCDMINNVRKYENDEYNNQAKNHPDFLQIHSLIQLLCKTYKRKVTDKNLNLEKKIELFNNSIQLAEGLCEDMRNQPNYIACKKLKKVHDTMFENCYSKSMVLEDIEFIFYLLEQTNTNFIIQLDDGSTFYPLITDFLVDTFTLEYSFELNKDLVDIIKPKFDSFSIKIDILETSGYIFYSKVDFIKQIGRKKINLFILHEYARSFNCDLSTMRELYKELLYLNAKDHPTALTSKKFNIKDVRRREFILTQSKFVLDFSDNPININYENITLAPVLLMPSFQDNSITI